MPAQKTPEKTELPEKDRLRPVSFKESIQRRYNVEIMPTTSKSQKPPQIPSKQSPSVGGKLSPKGSSDELSKPRMMKGKKSLESPEKLKYIDAIKIYKTALLPAGKSQLIQGGNKH